jgi:hypothetical protein
MIVGSHEVIEAASDPGGASFTWGFTPESPSTSTVWQSIAPSGDVEAADPCQGSLIWEDGGNGAFPYQRIWSNSAVDAGGDPCLPALAVPYYNVVLDQEWFATDGGSALEIPLTGWSTAPTGDWLVQAYTVNVSPGYAGLSGRFLNVTTSLGLEGPAACAAFGMNDGVAGTLEVPALPVAPGDFAVIDVVSKRVDQSCNPLPGQDSYHSSYVGMFVPPPSGCGKYNFVTNCDAQFYCPANASCGANQTCNCNAGFSPQSCSGAPCNGDCSFPDWWCD